MEQAEAVTRAAGQRQLELRQAIQMEDAVRKATKFSKMMKSVALV